MNLFLKNCWPIISIFLFSCEKEVYLTSSLDNHKMKKYDNKIIIDSSYIYHEDKLYSEILENYTKSVTTKSLSPEDNDFFNRKIVIKSTEVVIPNKNSYIYPGAIFEGNCVSTFNFTPVFVNNRRPITLSTNLTHKTPKKTSKIIEEPSYSEFSDYVKDIVADGNFKQNDKFMFYHNRFTFYNELKKAFGTNINTSSLFSSRQENSTEYHHRILKSTGLYVKFYQSCFDVTMNIAPLSDDEIKGKSGFEPLYINKVTFGRLGILVIETDESYDFAEQCINKEFNRIFYHKDIKLEEKEVKFFNETEIKILIIGADSDYAVHTIKGYHEFLNMIKNSTFSEENYGSPISCSFSYANTHELAEIEIIDYTHIAPLFVKMKKITENNGSSNDNSYYNYSSNVYLEFYKDRYGNRTKPHPKLVFTIDAFEKEYNSRADIKKWPNIISSYKENHDELIFCNSDITESNGIYHIYIGKEISNREQSGPAPTAQDRAHFWYSSQYDKYYILRNDPYYLILK